MSAPEGYFLRRRPETMSSQEFEDYVHPLNVTGRISAATRPGSLPPSDWDERVLSDRGLGCCYAVIRWGLPVGIAFWGVVAWVVMR